MEERQLNDGNRGVINSAVTLRIPLLTQLDNLIYSFACLFTERCCLKQLI